MEFPGNFIGTQNTANTNYLSGVHSLYEVGQGVSDGTWPTNFKINQSLRFQNSTSSYLTRTVGNGNQTTFTVSGWYKKVKTASTYQNVWSSQTSGSDYFVITVGDYTGLNDSFRIQSYNGTEQFLIRTSAVHRDYNQWYHFTVAMDTTQPVESDRAKIYINGELITEFSSVSYPAQNLDIRVNGTNHNVGTFNTAQQYFDGYIAEINFIDGLALDASYFGFTHPTTKKWLPKKYTGEYGAMGYHLDFAGTNTGTGAVGTVGEDKSGNGNHFTSGGIASHDVTPDSPTNNFAMLNSLDISTSTLSDGNLKAVMGNAATKSLSTIPFKSGKYYCEVIFTSLSGDGCVGITKLPASFSTHVGYDSDSYAYVGNAGYKRNSASSTSYGDSYGVNDVVGIYFDDGDIHFTNNGVLQNSGTPAFTLGTTNTYAFAFGDNATAASSTLIVNFGQDATFGGTKTPTQVYTDTNGRGQFFYEPPAGALALCSANLEQAKNTPTEYITDETNKNIIKYNGKARVSKFSPFATDGYSTFFGAGASYIQAGTSTSDFNFLHNGSATKYSVDGWFYLPDNDTGYRPRILHTGLDGGSSGRGIQLDYRPDLGGLRWTISNGTGSDTLQLRGSDGLAPIGWNYFVIKYDGSGISTSDTGITIHMNGKSVTFSAYQQDGSWGGVSTSNASVAPYIGNINTSSTDDRNFYLCDIRIMTGTSAENLDATAVPTSPPISNSDTKLLVCASNKNRFTDEGTSNYTLTTNLTEISDYSPYAKPNTVTQDLSIAGGSFEFDGTNEDIEIPYSSDFETGALTLTYEFWVYPTDSSSSAQALFSNRESNNGFYLRKDSSGEITVRTGTTSTSGGLTTSNACVHNAWNHVAVVYNNGTITAYINGVSGGTATDNTTNYTNEYRIGDLADNSQPFTGYITDLRVVKGKAVYTGAFTPPTAPLTQTSKTILLLQPYSKVKQSDGVYKNIDNYNQDEIGGKLTYTNGTQIVDISPYSKGDDIGSLLFDGVDDILLLPTISAVGTSDFTIEMWFKEIVNASSTYDGFLSLYALNPDGTSGSTAHRIQIAVHNGVLHYYSGNWYSTGWEPTTRKWHHVAFVRDYSAPTFKLYVDGTEVYSLSTIVANKDFNVNWSGTLNRMGVHSSYNNYLATDVRITKQALYTGAFTPPRYPLSTDKYVTDGTNQSATGPSTTTTYTVTVASGTKYDGTTGNRYVIDGEPFETVTLHRGSTYRFDVSDSTFGSNAHPFRFSSNENNSPSAAYTTGVTTSGDGGSAGAYVEIVVANDAPDNLYYYCTNHSGMGGTIKVEGGRTITADSVVLHIQPGKKEHKSEVFEFASMNKLNYVGANITLANNGYSVTSTAAQSAHSSFSVSSGKWYVEASGFGSSGAYVGVQEANTASPAPTYTVSMSNLASQGIGFWTQSYSIYSGNGTSATGQIIVSADGTESVNPASDVVAMAIDMDSSPKTVQWLVNNTRVVTVKLGSNQYIAQDGTTGTASTTFADISNLYVTYNGGTSNTRSVDWNFGQDPTILGNVTPSGGTNADNGFPDEDGNGSFRYAPPSGYKAMGRLQKPAQVVSDAGQHPEKYFNTVLYRGNSGTQSITGLDFKPDFVWIKKRSGAANHMVYDSNRGPNRHLHTNTTDVEVLDTDGLSSFNIDGFTLDGANGNTNTAGDTYVAWCWKAGDTIVPNTNGTTPSVVSVNKDAGFSIVKWNSPGGTAGATYIGHGLDKKPDIVFVKSIEASENWHVYYSFVDGSNDYVYLNLTDAKRDSSQPAPTSDHFYWSGGTGNDYIAYCWYSVPGYSKIGKYEGNANVDGSFVYTGFKPAFVMTKSVDGVENWAINDNKRSPVNPVDKFLRPDETAVDSSSAATMDFLSNGFKLRTTDTKTNASHTFIYMAFAEAPFTRTSAK